MLVDTHCHLRMMEGDIEKAVAGARAAGLAALVYSATEPDDWNAVIAATEQFDNVYGTLGIHPEYADKKYVIPAKAGISSAKIVGVGEIGLDYHYEGHDKSAQRDLFAAQLDMAREANLPVAVHSRDAEDDTYGILEKYDGAGVMHCFTGTAEFAKKMLDRGFYISASGIITFKNADALRETFSKIPLDRIVVETDAPFCAPVPHRGKECRPEFVVETARALAALRGLAFEEMENILLENTYNLYPKMRGGHAA
ncbi:MAG: TatD family hydrolase [Rickettsiales bacterium]|jgi:TatD DNase family protein|nr:TatD family hydrolase [Rickettsiales bacterium]